MSGYAKRLTGIVLGTAIVCVLLGLYIGVYLTNQPGPATAAETSAGAQLYLGTVPAAALNDPHPTWVSYYAVDPNGSDWRHVTTYVLPANTVVHVTIYNFDSQTGLRNPFIAQVFAIPQLGVLVPIEGTAATAKNPCSNAPCALSFTHTTTSFTFKTGKRGLYRWQCFVPCAAGYIEGWGGPMQTVGYMDGFIKVV
jgi:hypothetical protein